MSFNEQQPPPPQPASWSAFPQNFPGFSFNHDDHEFLANKRARQSEENLPNFPPPIPFNSRMNPPAGKNLCVKFSDGNCRNGDSCNFAHGIHYLRHPPSNWQELVGGKELGTGRSDEEYRRDSKPGERNHLDDHVQTVCSFVKKSSKDKNIRKRHTDEENEDVYAKESSLISSNKKNVVPADNKLFFSTGSAKRSSNSDLPSKSPIFQFESSKEIQVQNDNRATATLDTETEFSKDARAIRERVLKQSEEALQGKNKGSGEEKLYKGIHGYTDYKAGFRRELTVASEKAGGSHGPLRASAHIRVSARFDYQPDICKDYKETGYCAYGDSCKFMHDRGDYKSGWQIEKEWDEAEKARKRNLAMGGGDDDEDGGAPGRDEEDHDDSLPFACFLCRQPFVDPVITRCKHYFCEHCALKHHSKDKKCFVCNQNTNGIFNTAFDILKRMKAEGK